MSPRNSQLQHIVNLSSGLRLAYRQYPHADVDYCGIVVKVGSRDDDYADPGMAHFVEHTIFKGTEKRSSWHIINRMERVGGELNAYTTKEETVIYTAAPAGNVFRALELIADLASSSRFPASELDKEREVVADEINSYLDTPSDAVYDDFEEQIFANTQLAHNILGNAEALSHFDSQKCCSYLSKWYVESNIVVFYCGGAPLNRVSKAAEKAFSNIRTGQVPTHRGDAPTRLEAFSDVKSIGSHQAHTVMGALAPGMYDKRRFASALLTNILGGPGMNSLLNVQLREKRGYVYSVEASATQYTDCGLFTIYFGCDPEDTEKCEALVRKQLEALASEPLSDAYVARAKKQYLGQLAVASDARENSAINLGRAVLFYDVLPNSEKVKDAIMSVTAHDLREEAAALLPLSTLTLK